MTIAERSLVSFDRLENDLFGNYVFRSYDSLGSFLIHKFHAKRFPFLNEDGSLNVERVENEITVNLIVKG